MLALASTASTVDAASSSPCPATISAGDSTLQKAYAEFKHSVEAGPLARRLGRITSCVARVEGGAIHLRYESSTGANLEARRDPAVELTEQRLGNVRMSQPAAMTLLRSTERWAFGDKGCSVTWNKQPTREAGATPSSYDLVYRGSICNCQARLVHEHNVVTGLVFSSAC